MCPNPATVTCKAVDGNKGTKKGVCRYNNEGVLYLCKGADCMDMKVSGTCPPGEICLPRVIFTGFWSGGVGVDVKVSDTCPPGERCVFLASI